MTKQIPLSILTLLLFLIPVRPGSAENTLKVGVIAPLTGLGAAWGEDSRNAILFADKKFGAGRFKIVFEDDQCLGRLAVSASHKLLTIDKIDIAIVVCTESTISVAPIFKKNKALLIAPVASGATVAQVGGSLLRMWPSDDVAAGILFDHMSKSVARIAALTEERGYSVDFMEALKKAAKGSSLEIEDQRYATETTDFRSMLLKLRQKKPQALFINTNGEGMLTTILKQLHGLHWAVPVYGAYMPGSPSFLELAGTLSEGIEFVDAPSAGGTLTAEGEKLYAEYVAQYGVPRSSSFVFVATVEAFRRLAGLPEDRTKWRQELTQERILGIFGEYSFDLLGNVNGVRHVIKKIVAGQAKVIF